MMYYYCIVCQGLHEEKHTPGKVFEKGFYIDETGTGAKFHLGMCDLCVKEKKLHVRKDYTFDMIDNWLPAYELIEPEETVSAKISAIKDPVPGLRKIDQNKGRKWSVKIKVVRNTPS
ncbi:MULTISPECIES: DUF3973 domain-containing protein [Paenibacillus]|uniref:DUF3973 domain-containing protein n=1 Tax=Paenibacillus azoreducens TaxID=116718 RepID=A0A919YIW5_9BACL|nr:MULTISPECIES: DUF3973 domain-containing protein [Paenibacillus]GIO49470.1 hypothetical protein J34TS1_42350 [Paenibacillus azoreducens]